MKLVRFVPIPAWTLSGKCPPTNSVFSEQEKKTMSCYPTLEHSVGKEWEHKVCGALGLPQRHLVADWSFHISSELFATNTYF